MLRQVLHAFKILSTQICKEWKPSKKPSSSFLLTNNQYHLFANNVSKNLYLVTATINM